MLIAASPAFTRRESSAATSSFARRCSELSCTVRHLQASSSSKCILGLKDCWEGSTLKWERRRNFSFSKEGLTHVTICRDASGDTKGQSLRACSRLRTSRAVIVVWKIPFREKTTIASSILVSPYGDAAADFMAPSSLLVKPCHYTVGIA
jgi:hypothetical protein